MWLLDEQVVLHDANQIKIRDMLIQELNSGDSVSYISRKIGGFMASLFGNR